MDRSSEKVIYQIDKLSNSIIWATERDFDPIFTRGYSPLLRTYSENYKIEQSARKNINNDFDITNEFVIQHKHSVSQNYLEKYLENHKRKFKRGNKLLPCPIRPFNDWREEVRQWWNDWVDNGWKPKKKQMLIISRASNTGKSFFVTQALFRKADSKNELLSIGIFTTVPQGCKVHHSPFAFQHADNKIH